MSTRVPSRGDIYDALRTGKALICAPGEKPDVGAWLDFTTALLKVLRDPDITPHPDGLTIQGAYFADGLKLNNYAINHDLRFENCTFPLPVEAKYAKFRSLYFSECTVSSINLESSLIDGTFYIVNPTVGRKNKPFINFLNLLDTKITRGFFTSGLNTSSDINATKAEILVYFHIENSVFENLTLSSATINGELVLADATLTNPEGHALTLDRATITGSLFAEKLEAEGEVYAPGATINGQLNLTDATLTNPEGHALTLDRATITDLFLNYKTVDRKISLANTRISYLRTPDVIEPRHGKILATGWKVNSIEGALHTNPETAKKWLATTPDNEFSPQPFMELARYFDRVGLPHRARHLRVYSHSQVTNNMPLKYRPGRWMLHVMSGYGERPWYALVCIVLLFELTWLLTWWQADHLEAGDQVWAVCRDGWRITEYAVKITDYAGKNAIPSFPGATTKCSLADDTPIWLRLSFAFTAGLSWIMLTIFLAGVAGILRKPADSSTS
ncbi:hypothetical protein OS125_02125 [Corynebacterium sp. P7003]|uniref:Oxidoreductase n=1 Tax=Corynebacterium pygosceleis TaxID=2800406 RepID=A0ABT3WPQ5_9CORY|nr:hypothetical protein [Corynebacterium pygosceleis]MCX7444043.1 hypothetical protein [Corynebacterium pygosceleis]